MKSRGLEETSTPMFTVPLISSPDAPPRLIITSSNPYFSLGSAAFPISHPSSPLMPSFHLFLAPSLISHSLHTFCLSHLITSSPPSPSLPSPPTHSWYSTDLSGQLYNRSAEKGALPALKGSSTCSSLLQYACV